VRAAGAESEAADELVHAVAVAAVAARDHGRRVAAAGAVADELEPVSELVGRRRQRADEDPLDVAAQPGAELVDRDPGFDGARRLGDAGEMVATACTSRSPSRSRVSS
jgi:hypothetical protein